MDKTLLDTDIFSEVLKAKAPKVVMKAAAYHAQFGRYTIAAITVMEVVKGLHKLQQPTRAQQFIGQVAGVEILRLDTSAAEPAGLIYAGVTMTQPGRHPVLRLGKNTWHESCSMNFRA